MLHFFRVGNSQSIRLTQGGFERYVNFYCLKHSCIFIAFMCQIPENIFRRYRDTGRLLLLLFLPCPIPLMDEGLSS